MYYKLKKGKLKNLIESAWKKAKTIRNLEKKTGIRKSEIYYYHKETRPLNLKNLIAIEKYLKIKINENHIKEILPDNWKQIKGGKNCVKIKKKNGTYEKQLAKFLSKTGKGGKNMHRKLKKENPEKYYRMQYEKFKKIGGYKYTTKNGEKVRNELEKDVADILKDCNIRYEYEPYVNIKDKAFFPDFLINNKIIIECTAWKGFDKAIKLKEKIKHLKRKYKVYVVVPKPLNKYYKILNKHLILGLDEFVPVAQTFRDDKTLEREQLVEHMTVKSHILLG